MTTNKENCEVLHGNTRQWLDNLLKSVLDLEPFFPDFLGLATDTPEWVEKLEAGIGHDLFKPAKAKDAAKMSPRRCGSTLGNLKGLAEWLEEWFEAECKDLEEIGPNRSVSSLLVVAHAEVLQRLAAKGGSRVQDQAPDGKRLTSRVLWLRLTLADLEDAARRLYIAKSEQGGNNPAGTKVAMGGSYRMPRLGKSHELSSQCQLEKDCSQQK